MNKRSRLISIICLVCIICTMVLPVKTYGIDNWDSGEGIWLYDKNNVTGHFVHKGPIQGTIYDGTIDITGNEVDGKWRMEEVKMYEQSDYADKRPNGHYYRTVGYATMLVKVGEDGELIPLSQGNPYDPQSIKLLVREFPIPSSPG